ncbi:MAG: arginase family protein [Nocardioides sp.]|uniref:arginase family protein n=1 Tax=Nocardioides sp. TaxID=35761 RepID=UPI0039E668C8
MNDLNPTTGSTLRLVWPQWQGGGSSSFDTFFGELPRDQARRGYAVGTTVLESVLPPHHGPVARVPVSMSDEGIALEDGVEARQAVLTGLRQALVTIAGVGPRIDRILTLGGECSVSVAPFSVLANLYGEDLAVVWIDSHPDVGTPHSEYPGYHAMAVAVLTGHGDPEIVAELPETIDGARVALAGLHSWTDDDIGNATEWGIASFSPDALRTRSDELLEWLTGTGCSRVAIHVDVDAVDSNEVILGLGIEPDGLTTTQVRRVIADIAAAADVVGVTIAEYIPRQVMRMQALVDGFPLI